MTKNNKWDGILDITYKNKKGDIFYYDVTITFGKKKVTFVLPRYKPMVGWIEVFGLPPQNEWVFLEDSASYWKKTTPFTFTVDKKVFRMKESLEVFPDYKHNRRSLELVREIGKEKEVQTYEEDWSKMEREGKITKRSIFKGGTGHYFVDEEAFLNPSLKTLSSVEKKFVEIIKKKHGNPTLGIWVKHATMRGAYPKIYQQLFPFWNNSILQAKEVRTIELGYEISKGHGDWYKLFEIGGQLYEIEEDNYTEREEVYNGKKVSIKNTYRKKIRKI
jgi:hypothetical protein